MTFFFDTHTSTILTRILKRRLTLNNANHILSLITDKKRENVINMLSLNKLTLKNVFVINNGYMCNITHSQPNKKCLQRNKKANSVVLYKIPNRNNLTHMYNYFDALHQNNALFSSLCEENNYNFCIDHLFDKTMRIRIQMLKQVQQLYEINDDIISFIFGKILRLHIINEKIEISYGNLKNNKHSQ